MAKLSLDTGQWQQILPLFDEALELTDVGRAELLEKLDREQPAVAHSLRELLAQHEILEAKDFLEVPAMASLAHPSMQGRTVGAYVIESLIGSGGMGEVWLAQRSDGRFERKVAVKLMHASLLSRNASERFEQEGRLLARLTHQNIARLLDAGVTAQHRPYIVLEYVEGQPIDRYCDERSLGIDARLRLFMDVLAAVIHAQNNLVVHRDLKPSNVLVMHDGGVVKLLDFGIAKLVSDETAPGTEATMRFGEVLTPEYAAPEQILGEPVSTATDVYQLGVLLYKLLVGSHPYVLSASSRHDIARTALETEPARMSDSVDRPELRKTLRGDLDAIVAKALRKHASERYSSAASLAEDLRRYLDHQPVAARGEDLRYRAGKFIRRHRGSLFSSTAIALGLIATTVLALTQMREAQVQRDEARLQSKRADTERRFMTLMMASIGPGGRPASLEEIIDKGVVLLEKQYGDEPEFVVDMLVGLSGRYFDLGMRQKEYAVLTKAEAIARTLGPQTLAKVQCNTVETEIMLGDLRAAAQTLEESRAALARVPDPDLRIASDCLRAEAFFSDAQGRVGDAILHAERSVELLEQGNETLGIRYASALSLIERMHSNAGNFRKAMEFNRRGQAADERAGRTGTVGMLINRRNEAQHLAELGEVRDALARLRNALERMISESSGTSLHPSDSRLYGELLLRMDQPAEALRRLDESLQEWRTMRDIPQQVYVGTLRSRALFALGRSAEALAELPTLAVVEEARDSASRRSAVRAGILRAELLLAHGEPAAAGTQIDRVLASEKAASDLAGFHQPALVVAARIALANGRAADAVRLATEAWRIAERQALNAGHSADVGESLLVLATARKALGNELGARDSARRAHESLQYGLGPEHSLTRTAAGMFR